MEALHIIAGFKDIKLQLAQSCRIFKDLNDIYLWFSIEENVLYAHDNDQHESYIALAILTLDNREIEKFFSISHRAQKLVESKAEYLKFDLKVKELAEALNLEFKLNGSFRP